MAVQPCPDCGKPLSDSARECQHCGRLGTPRRVEAYTALFCIAIALCLVAYGCVKGSG